MRLSLTALGLLTAIGADKDAVADCLFRAPASGLAAREGLIPNQAAWVGAVAVELPQLPAGERHHDCRNNRLALAALSQIAPEIAAARARYGAARIAVILGTSTSGIAEGETALSARLREGAWPADFRYAQQEPGNLALFVADHLTLEGPAYTIHTACSSSGKAFAAAARLIRAGYCDAALVGGVDSLSRLTINGFHALGALSPGPCNPFSRNRQGISIGEGAAIFLMEPAAGTIALLGVGESSDAHHISAPDPSGAGALSAMTAALADAGLTASDIGYINLHGTATPLNDAMEGKAVAELFGTATPCSSTKALSGHTLGAAAAIEAAFLWLALSPDYGDLLLPPHRWDEARDSEIPPLRLARPGDRLPPSGPTAMLSNSFAFGGSNVSLVLGREAR